MSSRTSAYVWNYKQPLNNLCCYETFRTIFLIVSCACIVFAVKCVFILIVLVTLWKLGDSLHQRLFQETFSCQDYGVIITGCDTGFGHAIARHLDSLGFTVFSGCYRPSGHGARVLKAHCSRKIHIVPLDVTSDDAVESAFNYVKSHLPKKGLWGVVNNAGRNVLGEVELAPLHMVHGLMNVNFYGALRVTKTFLPLLRSSKGRCVTVTSVYGQLFSPIISAYTASKHGLETLMDSLRLEMSKFGVNVSIVEPGFFDHATCITDEENIKRLTEEVEAVWKSSTLEQQQTYKKNHLLSWLPRPIGGRNATGSSWPVVRAVTHALTCNKPETRYLVAGTYRWLYDEYAIMTRLLPRIPTWLTDRFVVWWTQCAHFQHNE